LSSAEAEDPEEGEGEGEDCACQWEVGCGAARRNDLLATSEEKFIAQSICKTRRELKEEHFTGSVDQLSVTFLQKRVISPRVVKLHATVKAVVMYSDIRSLGMVLGKSSKYKARIVNFG
jgi:hypothetical protein